MKNTTRTVSLADVLDLKLKDPSIREQFERDRDDLSLGMEIARLRKEAGLSQAELAALAGMRKQNISRLESPDYSSHRTDTLRRLAGALGVKIRFTFVRPSNPGAEERRVKKRLATKSGSAAAI